MSISSSTKDMSFLHQTFSLVTGTWDSWGPALLVKSEAKKDIQPFSLFCATRSPISFSNGSTFSPVFLSSPWPYGSPFSCLWKYLWPDSVTLGFWPSHFHPWMLGQSLFIPPRVPIFASFSSLSLARCSLLIHTGLLAFFFPSCSVGG